MVKQLNLDASEIFSKEKFGNMWRLYVVLSVILVWCIPVWGQQLSEAEALLRLMGAEDPEYIDAAEAERLAAYLERPMKINMESLASLVASGLMSRYQAAALDDYRSRHGDILSFMELVEPLTNAGIKVYAAHGNPAEYYSIVDHHYNYYGAYAAYRAITDKLTADGWALPVLTEEDVEFVELPNPYIGSRNRKLYNLWENEDKAIVLSEVPVPYTRYDNGQPSEKPLFVYPAEAHMPTTYNLYMGGDFAETVLETNRPELPDALIFGDSFSNALETLLYTAFDETHILDLRHYKEQSLKDYLADYRPDIVICIQNDTFYYTKGGNSAVWED